MEKNCKKWLLAIMLAAVVIPRDAHAIKPVPFIAGVGSAAVAYSLIKTGRLEIFLATWQSRLGREIYGFVFRDMGTAVASYFTFKHAFKKDDKDKQ